MPKHEAGTDGEAPLIHEAAAWLAKLRLSSGPREQEAFETWYAADPAHADAYDKVLRGWTASGKSGNRAGALAPHSPKWVKSRPTVRHAMPAAAAILLIVLTGLGLNRLGLFGGWTKPEMQLASKIGEIRTVRLEDGSRITLDTSTVIRIVYSSAERRVELERGRARFDVAHDSDRPFVVLAGGGSITAHGTLFDVAVVDRHVSVALLRGSIEVRRSLAQPATDDVTATRMLVPGQRLSLSKTEPLQPPQPLSASEASWISGMLSFEDTPLADVVAAANRYNNRQIIVIGRTSRGLRFSGTVRATDVAGLAKMLAVSFCLKLSPDKIGNFVLAAPAG